MTLKLLIDSICITVKCIAIVEYWLFGMLVISSQQMDILDDKQLYKLFILMAQQKVGNRPGRIEPRAVKRRTKAYPLLTKPRDESRENIKRYGFPKKLK